MVLTSLWITSLFLLAVGNDDPPVIVGQTFMAGGADPTVGSTGWALVSHGIAEKLFTVAEDGSVVGQLAESVAKLDTDLWQVNLKCDYKFSDGTPVTAEHVSAALTLLNSENTNAQASLGDMTMTVVGDLQLNIQSERPTPAMAAVLAEYVFVIFLKRDTEYFYTGPYEIETFSEDEEIVMVPNEHYHRAADRKHLTIKKYADGEALATAIEAEELDMAFHLPVDRLTDLRAADGISVRSFPVGYQYMMWHNIRRAPLSDVLVRRAVDTVLDRTALAIELRGGDATRSFFANSPYHYEPDDAELHGQHDAAAALLDDAGWVVGGGGLREKDGVELTLNVVAYPQRPGLVIMHPLVGASLESLGITVQMTVTSGANWDELDQIMADKDYDLLMWAQHVLPAGDPQMFLSNFFRSDAGSNHAGFNSPEVDNLIDELSHAEMGTDRVAATTAAHRAIQAQVPVSMLVAPDWHVGLRSRLADYNPWGSDYYIIRSDFGLSGAVQQGSTDCATETGGADNMMPSGMLVASVFLLGCMF